MNAGKPVYIVQITDTHIGPTRDYGRHGHVSLPCAQRAVEVINSLPVKPDAVVHTGDVVTNPDPASFLLAAEVLGQLDAPIYYVVGNHDTAADIRRHLPMGPRENLSDNPDLLSYAFVIRGHRFLVLDARAPDELDPHGLVGEEQMSILDRETAPEGPPLTVFVHFPLWPMNSPWFDENMLILNGPDVHKMLSRAAGRLRGVFHGHIHMPMQTYKDGVMYGSAASTFANFACWPNDPSPRFPDSDPGFAFLNV